MTNQKSDQKRWGKIKQFKEEVKRDSVSPRKREEQERMWIKNEGTTRNERWLTDCPTTMGFNKVKMESILSSFSLSLLPYFSTPTSNHPYSMQLCSFFLLSTPSFRTQRRLSPKYWSCARGLASRASRFFMTQSRCSFADFPTTFPFLHSSSFVPYRNFVRGKHDLIKLLALGWNW